MSVCVRLRILWSERFNTMNSNDMRKCCMITKYIIWRIRKSMFIKPKTSFKTCELSSVFNFCFYFCFFLFLLVFFCCIFFCSVWFVCVGVTRILLNFSLKIFSYSLQIHCACLCLCVCSCKCMCLCVCVCVFTKRRKTEFT